MTADGVQAEHGTASIEPIVRVTDLKQWVYCPRVVFYGACWPVETGPASWPAPTEPMARGRALEEVAKALERRRTVRRYGLDAATRRFAVRLFSRALGLTGEIDILLEIPARPESPGTGEGIPVDLKATEGGVRRNHRYQLAAYGLLIQEVLGLAVRRGFVHLLPSGRVVDVPLPAELLEETRRMIDEIRTTIATQRFPDPTDRRAKCWDCEFLRFCGDRL